MPLTLSQTFRPLTLTLGFLTFVTILTAWSLYTHHLIITAQSSYPPSHWKFKARTDVYGLCYDGCGDNCLYPSVIADACHITTRTNLSSSGIECDAARIWWWEDRYPIECLKAVGRVLESDAVRWRRFWLRGLYLVGVVFAGLGFVVIVLLLTFIKGILEGRGVRRSAGRIRDAGVRAPLLPNAVIGLVVLVLLVTPTIAYPCTDLYPAYEKPFVNMDGSVFGVVHGWLTDCVDESYDCGQTCGDGKGNCRPITCTRPRARQFSLPRDFVTRAEWRVERCGFRFVYAVPGMVERRVPNPRIEGKLWVRIAVNRFNATKDGKERLDEGVKCLYEMI